MPELYPQLYTSKKLFVIPATDPISRDGKAAKSEVSQKTCQFRQFLFESSGKKIGERCYKVSFYFSGIKHDL
jgi:hypothetical protein